MKDDTIQLKTGFVKLRTLTADVEHKGKPEKAIIESKLRVVLTESQFSAVMIFDSSVTEKRLSLNKAEALHLAELILMGLGHA